MTSVAKNAVATNGITKNGVAKNGDVHHVKQNNAKLSQEEILLLSYTQLAKIPNKDTWEKIAKAFNFWMKIPQDKLDILRDSNMKFYIASLLLDDMQDDAALRDGKPSAHQVHGIPNTLNTYYYACAQASEKILQLNHSQAMTVYREQLIETCRGRRMNMHWRDTVTCPSEKEYKEMVIRRTRGIITVQIKLMQLFSKNQADYGKLAGILGLYINIRGDYQRLKSTDTEDEDYCEDITLGNFTYPIIHAIKNNAEDGSVITEILRQRTKNLDTKKYIVSLLERLGSFEQTKNKLQDIKKEILKEIKKLGGNPLLENFIEKEFNDSILL